MPGRKEEEEKRLISAGLYLLKGFKHLVVLVMLSHSHFACCHASSITTIMWIIKSHQGERDRERMLSNYNSLTRDGNDRDHCVEQKKQDCNHMLTLLRSRQIG